MLDTDATPAAREATQILARARCLMASALAVHARAADRVELRRVAGALVAPDEVRRQLLPLERRALERPGALDEDDLRELSWQPAGAEALLWALGRVPALALPPRAPAEQALIEPLLDPDPVGIRRDVGARARERTLAGCWKRRAELEFAARRGRREPPPRALANIAGQHHHFAPDVPLVDGDLAWRGTPLARCPALLVEEVWAAAAQRLMALVWLSVDG